MEIIEKKIRKDWKEFILINNYKMQVNILNFGGIITKILTPNKYGKMENVVLGYKNYTDYENDPFYFGSIIGPVAGRIPQAKFRLNGKSYQLEPNEGDNLLHSGVIGFHNKLWDVKTFQNSDRVGIKLFYTLDDEKFPGKIHVEVSYTLTNNNDLILDYNAKSTKDTIITLTNHTYFNLSGNLKDTIHNHYVNFESDSILELDDTLIPTGNKLDTTNTTFDFRKSRKLGDGLSNNHLQHKLVQNGYDHYFIFHKKDENNIIVREPTSGRKLTITTDQPGMVMYTANTLEEGLELTERTSGKYLGVCFETQASPASLFYKDLPNILLKKDEVYKQKTTFSFEIE